MLRNTSEPSFCIAARVQTKLREPQRMSVRHQFVVLVALQAILLVGFLHSSSMAQEAVTLPGNDGAKAASAKLADVAWIAGSWRGQALGGEFEETWNPPLGDSMVGMFKLVRNQKVEFYELLTIVEHKDSLLLRLKHFDKGLVGWEEKGKSVEFPAVSFSESEAVFDGLRFVRIDDKTMHILVNTQKGEQTSELKFVCSRADAVAPKSKSGS